MAKPWNCTLQTKPKFLAVWGRLEQLPWVGMGSSVTQGCPNVGQSRTGSCPSDVGLRRPCPGSLLCKEGFASTLPQGHCQEQGTPQWETALVTPGHQPSCPSRLPHFPAWLLPSNKILALAVKTHQFPAAQVPAWPQGNDIPLVASSCKPQNPTARSAGPCRRLQHRQVLQGEMGVKSRRKMQIFTSPQQVH